MILTPGNARVIPLEPEFITPQDGYDKQDCENAAAKRWLAQYGPRYRALGITRLADDLYCKQPLCEAIAEQGMNFILVCKHDSHKTLYEWVAGFAATYDVSTLRIERRRGKRTYTDTYRFGYQLAGALLSESTLRRGATWHPGDFQCCLSMQNPDSHP